MTNEAKQNREKIEAIKAQLSLGQISYAEAKEQAAPIVNAINLKAKELAKKYGMRPHLVDFAALMR